MFFTLKDCNLSNWNNSLKDCILLAMATLLITPPSRLKGNRGATTRKRTYKRREGAAPRWPEKPYAWSFLQTTMVAKGLNPKGLADAMGCELNPIYEWLNGTDTPRAANLRKLASALGVDLPDLLASLPIHP